MKVSELVGEDLDYWVAKAAKVEIYTGEAVCRVDTGELWYPSLDWSVGGPIIESERIFIAPLGNDEWWAGYEDWCENCQIDGADKHAGPTPLIAAMRAYVKSRFGETVPESD